MRKNSRLQNKINLRTLISKWGPNNDKLTWIFTIYTIKVTKLSIFLVYELVAHYAFGLLRQLLHLFTEIVVKFQF
jgi:hypothetical protein